MDLGLTWRKLSDNVVEDRYYWRRMGTDPLGAVYYEKNVTGQKNYSKKKKKYVGKIL